MDKEKIKQLRDQTGLSFSEINKALTEAGGDEEKAILLLKARGADIAAKKASRQVSEGVVDAYIHATGKVGAMIELLCETDFVARNEEFRKLAHDLAMHITAIKPKTNNELLDQPFVRDPAITVQDLINQIIQKVGENIQVGKFDIFDVKQD